jgi:hypothetical protein
MIRVELVMVHLSNEGEKDYELNFVDDDGRFGGVLRVGPDGSMELLDEDDE